MLSSSPSGATRPGYIRPLPFDPPRARSAAWCSRGILRYVALAKERCPGCADRTAFTRSGSRGQPIASRNAFPSLRPGRRAPATSSPRIASPLRRGNGRAWAQKNLPGIPGRHSI